MKLRPSILAPNQRKPWRKHGLGARSLFVPLTLVAVAALGLSVSIALAAFPDDSVTHYAGCLSTGASPGGTFVNVAVGDVPSKPCGSGQVLVHLSGGDVTAVRTPSGSGLSGGTDNGAASLSLNSVGCSDGGVLKWSSASSLWACGSDNNTIYNGSDFALSNQSCSAGSFDTGIDSTGNLTCAPPPSSDAYLASNGDDDFNPPVIPGDNQYHPVIALAVPAGVYAVTARGMWRDFDTDAYGICKLQADGSTIDTVDPVSEDTGVNSVPVALIGTAALPSDGSFSVVCNVFTFNGVEAPFYKILALRVGAIH
jgi:hypothetical protein